MSDPRNQFPPSKSPHNPPIPLKVTMIALNIRNIRKFRSRIERHENVYNTSSNSRWCPPPSPLPETANSVLGEYFEITYRVVGTGARWIEMETPKVSSHVPLCLLTSNTQFYWWNRQLQCPRIDYSQGPFDYVLMNPKCCTSEIENLTGLIVYSMLKKKQNWSCC